MNTGTVRIIMTRTTRKRGGKEKIKKEEKEEKEKKEKKEEKIKKEEKSKKSTLVASSLRSQGKGRGVETRARRGRRDERGEGATPPRTNNTKQQPTTTNNN
jgi:hypothetical protein